MKRRDFCKALVCSAALAPGLVLPRAEAAAKSQTVGRAVPAGNYTMSFRSELSQMDIEHEYYYSDSFFADRKSTRLNSSHITRSRMPSSA